MVRKVRYDVASSTSVIRLNTDSVMTIMASMVWSLNQLPILLSASEMPTGLALTSGGGSSLSSDTTTLAPPTAPGDGSVHTCGLP